MDTFRNWYIRNQDAITWFLVGLLTAQTIEQLGRGNYISAAISAVLAYANYYMGRQRLQ